MNSTVPSPLQATQLHSTRWVAGLWDTWGPGSPQPGPNALLQKGSEQNRTNQHSDISHPKLGPESPGPSLPLTASHHPPGAGGAAPQAPKLV